MGWGASICLWCILTKSTGMRTGIFFREAANKVGLVPSDSRSDLRWDGHAASCYSALHASPFGPLRKSVLRRRTA